MSALDVNGFALLDYGQGPVIAPACPAPASPDDIAAVLRDGAHRLPPVAAALHPLLCEAAARLIAIARATGREVAVITARDGGGILWHGASAGDYLYDSARPAWSDPRPGDADYLWGERARAVVESLADAQWQKLGGPGRECLMLVARAGGAWLALAGDAGGPAEFRAIAPDRPLELLGFQHPDESRPLDGLFRAMVPLNFVTVDQFASMVARGEPAPEAEPVAETPEQSEAECVVEEAAPQPGLLARLLRRN
ncbi:MAG: hypothetical protein RIQ46_190 [Pseudomonadota bacterium]|jgi:hypothetical protein